MGDPTGLQVLTVLAELESPAGQAAIRAGVDARLRELAVAMKMQHGTPSSRFDHHIAEWGHVADRWLKAAAPREPAQDGGSASIPATSLAKPQTQPRGAAGAADIKALVDRFLAWKLPYSVCADPCATKQQDGRTGTNLLSAAEARQMIEHLLVAREPAQDEPAAGVEPPQHAEAMADLLRELEGWEDGSNSSDDTRRKHWLMRRAAATIRALTGARAAGFAEGVEAERKRMAGKIRDYAQHGSIPADTRDALLADLAPGSLASPTPAPDPLLPAWRDVLAERQRQVSVECWTPGHDDDEHRRGELALAAAAYCVHGLDWPVRGSDLWPWTSGWWKPKNRRRDLVRAAALLLAEIERLDRAEIARRGGA